MVQPLINHPGANAEVFLLAGLALGQTGDWAKALPILEKSVGLAPKMEDAHLALGTAYQMLGKMEESIHAYKHVGALNPNNADAWNNLGVVNEDTGRFADALDYYDQALALNPSHPNALRSRASVLGRLRKFDQAKSAYELLINRYPDDAEIMVGYAEFLEQANQPEQAMSLLPQPGTIENKVNDARAEAVRAKILVRQKDFDSALACLTAARKRTGEDFLCYREGIIHDRLGQYDQAISVFRRANQSRANQRSFRRLMDQPVTQYLNHKIDTPMEVELQDEQIPHRPMVFITGLPRSGTTLLDRMMDAHPQIQVFEELEGLRMAETALSEGNTPQQAQRLYWEFIARHVDIDEKKLVVDKNPLHVMHLDIIPKIFPQARVILVLRHPYDAALSCYMQDFDAGPVTARFLELKSTAQLCAQFLKLMKQFHSARPDLTSLVRYERLVQDFQQEMTRLLQFIDLSWDDSIADYATLAAKSNPIMTASYEQVTRSLYQSSIDRWKHYKQWLKPFDQYLSESLSLFDYDIGG